MSKPPDCGPAPPRVAGVKPSTVWTVSQLGQLGQLAGSIGWASSHLQAHLGTAQRRLGFGDLDVRRRRPLPRLAA